MLLEFFMSLWIKASSFMCNGRIEHFSVVQYESDSALNGIKLRKSAIRP